MNVTFFVTFVTLSYIGLIAVNADYNSDGVSDIKSTVESLFRRVESLQVKQDTPYIPPMFWQKHRGMWESDVRFYFHGHEELFLFREAFSIYDDNMFATAWITSCLLETFRYGNGPKPSEEMITAAILSIEEYHNKNVNYSNSLMTFWPQKYNATFKAWSSYPLNLHHFFDLAASFNATTLEEILDKVGLKDIAEIMERLLKSESGYLQAFMIPPDFDDTFVNLGLGALLAEMKDHFPASHAQWQSQNTNVSSVFDALKKYAYRPMSSNKAINSIDGRTYFYLRFFLENAKNNGEDIALVPTWIQDSDELKTWGERGVKMPLNANNIDVTVAANGVFGTTTSILNGVVDAKILDDPEIQQIYVNTSNLIAFMIETNFSSRHDLALLYYPSAIEFYWFVARTFGEIRRKENQGPLPHPILKQVKEKLDVSLHVHMTSAVLNQSKTDSDGSMYFDDFVGDGDLDLKNNTIVRGQDRLFTTGMAMNALLSTWTTFDEVSRKLYWEKGTPQSVKDVVSKSAMFLQNNMFGLRYQPWNAFFSGSVKGETTYPSYPMNALNESSHDYRHTRLVFEGVVSEEEYQDLLKKKWFGRKSPIDFHGYNNYPDYWPFWSSEPYTYVTSMLALAKFSNTFESNDSFDSVY
ncbi:uncharacterized protein LOC132742840 [Ruditapes philippinarum]|uniref:uncharacterized protein LOC132742840 n=1 Tax=Ruditapes philippinarum TaxID=129788 RepID=UPI00295B9725|nr:uncharacterized protein LOC132742840 [Ruditapes philippinarum]